MKKNSVKLNATRFEPKPLVLAVRHALPYLVALGLGAAVISPAVGRSGDSAAAFTATQLIRQFTLKNTVAQVSQGMQGYVGEFNGVLRASEMGVAVSGYPVDMGSVPSSVNLPQRDGAGRPLGYCAWDNSASTSNGSFLAGQGVANPLVYAVVSPGLNGSMQTSCAYVLANRTGLGDDHVQVTAPSQASSKQFKSAVGTYADLTAMPGEEGDIRLVLENNKLYSYVGGAWQPVDASKFNDDSAVNGAGAIAYTTGKVTVADFQAASATITGALAGSAATFSSSVTANSFAGNGAALTDLNASNVSSGLLGAAFGGTGVDSSAAAQGSLLIGTGAGFALGAISAGDGIGVLNGAGSITISNTGVLSIAGTNNQVIASAMNGDVVLSLPQDIATTSTPTFGGMTLNGGLMGTTSAFSGLASAASVKASTATAINVQGAYLQWNRDGGRTFLVNQKGLGVGGISFGEVTTSNAYTENMALSSTGNLTVVGSVTANSFSGNGSALTNLNANNFTAGTLPVARGGTGLSTVATNGQLLIGNGTGYALGTLTGTANQVNVTNGAGSITLSLPQAIATTSTPTFAGQTLTGALTGTTANFSGNTTVGGTLAVTGAATFSSLAKADAGLEITTGHELRLGTYSENSDGMFITRVNPATNRSIFRISAFQDFEDFGGLNVDEFQIGRSAIDRSSFIALFRMAGSGNAILTGKMTANSFAGDGSALTNLNANNFTAGTLPVARGGTGLDGSAAANGSLLIGNGTGYTLGTLTAGAGIGIANGAGSITINNTGVRSLTGTVNQVNVSAATGAITLSLPQGIATGSNVLFGTLQVQERAAVTTQGAHLQWDSTPAVGRTFLINQRGGGSGGISFGESTAGNVYTENMLLSAAGNLSVVGSVTANSFSGNGSALTNLNASNFTSGTVPVARGGTGLSTVATNGQLLIGNGTGYTLGNLTAGAGVGITNGAGTITISNTGVTSLAGTANQVNVSAATGAVTLSLPQAIATTSTPTFAGQTLTGALTGTTGTFSGTATAGSLFVRGNQAIGVQGSYLQWNREAGLGRTFLINQKGNGGGGISFGEATTGDVYTENMALSSTGNLTVVGSVTANSFSGNGSALTNLNASNFTSGTVPVARGGTGLSTVATNGQLLIGNGTGYTLGNLTAGAGVGITNGAGTITLSNTGVTSLAGTANQVNVSAATGAVTLSLPQSIGLGSDVQFGTLKAGSNTPISSQGAHLQWNRGGGGGGRTFLVNQKGLGGGGISFGEATTGDVYTENMALSSTGNLTVVGSVTANSFSGNGSALTNLNASNFTSGTVPVARGGTGLSTVATNGQLLIGNGTGYTLGTLTAGTGVGITNGAGTITISNTGVTSLAGTANQVNVSAATGAVTLSLPQAIATTSTPTFAGQTLTGALTGTIATFSGKVTVSSLTADRLDVSTSDGNVGIANMIVGKGAMTLAQSGPGANTALGSFALADNTTGFENTAVGRVALTANTTGSNNTAVGRSALIANTTGINNSAVGSDTLLANTEGSDNAAFGRFALRINTTGSNNVALGPSAGAANITGSNNTFLGSIADATTGALTYATAIGAGSTVATSNTLALGRNSTVDQVVIGTSTRNDTFANTKLYVNGVSNLNGDLQGTTATFTGAVTMGSLAAQRLDVGTSAGSVGTPNVIIGLTAMPLAQSGAGGNTAVGIASLNLNTSGAFNTAFGRNSLRDNSMASFNTAVGANAMLENETGGNNTAMGANALRSNIDGDENIAVGDLALNKNTTGSFNVAMGATAMFDNLDGVYSVALGYDTMRRNISGVRNAAVGNRALYSNLTGNLNTALGSDADVLATNLNYAAAIGAHARVASSDTLVIGALANSKDAAYSTRSDQVVIGATSRNDTIFDTIFHVAGVSNFSSTLHATGGVEISTGQLLRLGRNSESTDRLSIYRFNPVFDQSMFRIAIGDNIKTFGEATADEFQVGRLNADNFFDPVFRVAGNGDVIASGYMQATAFNVSSDRRLKTNIQAQDSGSVLGRLEQLQTYSYEYLANPNLGRRIGVIAQEIQNLFPEAVATRADGMMSVDYNALGAMAAMGVGQLSKQVKVLDKTVADQGQRITVLDERVNQNDTRISSLEGWRTDASKRMDGMQNAIELNIQKIAENAVAIQTNSMSIERLDDALFTLDGQVKNNSDLINNINSRWAKNFSESADGSLITVNAAELKVSNFTAQQMRANSVYSQRLEAEMARIADLEVNNLRANTAVANTVQAEQLNTGSVQVYAGVGLPAVLFAAKSDGHYTVSTSALDGSYATATVIVNAGQAKVVSVASEGIELYAEGNQVKVIAAGKSIKASWIKMG